jgi:uncharacterized delta-60 repeat protein
VGGTVGVNDEVYALALQPDGKIIVGGAFTTARGTVKNHIARLNADGSLDAGFNAGGTVGVSAPVYAIAVQPDDKVIISGSFITARGTTKNYIARLNADGSLDAGFNVGGTVGANSDVIALALQPDGKIIVGGAFTNARGVTQNRIARLNADGSLDTSFNVGGTVGVNGIVYALALQPDGKIIVGGAFTTARGAAQNRIASLDPDGGLSASALNNSMLVGGALGGFPLAELSTRARMNCA